MTTISQPDLLGTIVAATRRIVEVRAAREPRRQLQKRAAEVTPRMGVFRAALMPPRRIHVIAECKRRSPSAGVVRKSYDPAALARSFQTAGAAALSVLTEPTFFDGSLDHLREVRSASDLPVLRKDFIVDDYQIDEARAAGADAVLLIVAALSDRDLTSLHARATEAGLDALVEVHDAEELRRALNAGVTIIGVNNRNLRTLEVDTDTCERMIPLIPPGVVAVAESGLRSAADLVRFRQIGYSGFLIGEHLMVASDPADALRLLLAGANG